MHKPLVSFSELLDEVNNKLEPGIKADLFISGGNVWLQYSVRAMKRGKRQSLGTFFTHAGAQDALFAFKRSGTAVINEQEIAARSDVAMQAMGLHAVADAVVEQEELNMQQISELMERNKVYPYMLVGGTIDMLDKDGKTWRLFPAVASQWLKWSISEQGVGQDTSKDASKDMGQGDVNSVESVEPINNSVDPTNSEQVDNSDNSGAQQSGETDADYDARMAALFGLD
jgi:hypothetical protein